MFYRQPLLVPCSDLFLLYSTTEPEALSCLVCICTHYKITNYTTKKLAILSHFNLASCCWCFWYAMSKAGLLVLGHNSVLLLLWLYNQAQTGRRKHEAGGSLSKVFRPTSGPSLAERWLKSRSNA